MSVHEDQHCLPGVSCLCACYGRVHVLEEAVECFLRQDYEGPKELLILNDLDAQTLVFDHPEVRIVNRAERFATFGEKRDAMCRMAAFELLCHWDDDDIYLPHRLSYSVDLLGDDLDFVKPSKAFYWNNGDITGLESNMFHVQSCMRRELVERVGGYPHTNGDEDLRFERKLKGLDGIGVIDIPPERNFYLYRWAGVGHHLSGYDLRDAAGDDPCDRFDRDIRRGIAAGAVPSGRIVLEPHWKHDYEQQASAFLARLARKTTNGKGDMQQQIPTPRPGFALADMDGETLLYSHEQTTMVYLNQSAALVWRLCDGLRTVGEIEELLTAAYPEAADAIRADVHETISRFRRDEMLDLDQA